MTNLTPLSPAAQAVLDAYNAGFNRPVAVHHKPRIAAALRAAADQCINRNWSVEMDELYKEFYAIAAELEAH